MFMPVDFPKLSKHVTRDKMIRISGPGNIHSDEAMAASQGLGGIIAQGGQLSGYLNEMMTLALGDGFVRGGEIAVSFIHRVRPGDTVTTHGRLTSEVATPAGVRVECEVWLENQEGRKVTVGTASGFLPSPRAG